MSGLETAVLECPHCGERIELAVDCSLDQQEYVEDCSVCCRPITITVTALDGELVAIDARRDDE